ncbi:MAG TPA: hypothetical protein VF598_08570 [Hymenobacter sp.]|jgi:hypothetical protein
MNTCFSALDPALMGLNGRLALQVGLPEATFGALAREALPMMVQRLGTTAGESETALALCQKLARAQVYLNLSELTRPDGGWPEQRRYLAQTLLVGNAYAHLVAGHGTESASELLGYFALVLSTAGQQSIDQQLDGEGFQQWRQQVATGAVQRVSLDYSAVPLSAPKQKVAAGCPGGRGHLGQQLFLEPASSRSGTQGHESDGGLNANYRAPIADLSA